MTFTLTTTTRRLAKLALLCFVLLPKLVQASSFGLGDVTQGTLLMTQADGSYQPQPAQRTRVRIRVTGPIARAVVSQQFHNPGTTWAEALYAFPLPEDAAVDHLRMRIGERVIEGEVQEKAAARATYAAARDLGQRTALVEQQRPNLFTTAVANIPPGAVLSVEIEYQHALQWQDDAFSLRFPMAVTPRYAPGGTATTTMTEASAPMIVNSGWAVSPDALATVARPPRTDGEVNLPRHPVDLEVSLAPGFPLAEVRSRYHPVQHVPAADGQPYRVRLDAGQHTATQDFELRWRAVAGRTPQAAFFTETVGTDRYGLLMLMPASAPATQPPRPRETLFILDVSGSMQGPRMQQAREALQLAIETLTPMDRFNVIVFNDRAWTLFPQPVIADAGNRLRARQQVSALRADGGTEMLPALQLALAQGHREGDLRQVIFITDGAVSNEAVLLTTLYHGLGEARLFTVGIGHAPNTHFMTEAALAGRGSFTYIAESSEVREKMQALFAQIAAPVLTDLVLKLPVVVDTAPDPLPDLYRGQPVSVVMKLAATPHQAALTGRQGLQHWGQSLVLQSAGDQAGIGVLWARRKIDHWVRAGLRGVSEATVREEVLALALQHHLVSPYTSLVAVDRTPARPATEGLARNALPLDLPGDMTSVGLPQTATPSRALLLAGLLALLSARLLSRRRSL